MTELHQHARPVRCDGSAVHQKEKGTMNVWKVQQYLRAQFEKMDDYQLEEREELAITYRHRVTGQSFCEMAAEHLAAGLKRNPQDLARVKRITPRFAGLAQALLVYRPDDPDLKDIAEGWDIPPKARRASAYMEAMGSIASLPRVDNLLYVAERRAGQIPIPDGDDNPADDHLREERIDALASLLSLFSVPDAYAPDPVEHDAPDPVEHDAPDLLVED